jgi:hypothetical protein
MTATNRERRSALPLRIRTSVAKAADTTQDQNIRLATAPGLRSHSVAIIGAKSNPKARLTTRRFAHA